ncbi:MAG TPA: MtnX-like HAD-IB family phosphatase [Bacilli bacterium]|nr:MtnX-like HAD-IB family phosphatase [Bacilli bacterium]
MAERLVLICDFDGTITERDITITLVEKFGAEGWRDTLDRIMKQEISLKQGLGSLIRSLPAGKREEMAAFIQEAAAIRPGFPEFLTYCREQGLELNIVSNGVDFYIDPLLAPYDIDCPIHYNRGDFSGERIDVIWPRPCDEHCDNDCGMCKPSVLRQERGDGAYVVVIGDSVPDLAAAKLADFVIARSFLLEKCNELGLQHAPFATFYDVIAVLDEIGKGKQEEVLT